MLLKNSLHKASLWNVCLIEFARQCFIAILKGESSQLI